MKDSSDGLGLTVHSMTPAKFLTRPARRTWESTYSKGNAMTKTGWSGGWFAVAVALAALVPAPVGAQVTDAQAERAAATITVEELHERLSIVAHDSMRGRATPSPELRETAEYVAAEFESFGLHPGAGEDSWLQEYPLTRMRAGDPADHLVSIEGPSGSWDLELGEDYLAQYEAAASEGAGELLVYRVGDRVGDERPEVDGRIVAVRVTLENLQQVFGGSLGAMLDGEPAGLLLSLDVPDEFLGRLRAFLDGPRVRLGEPADSAAPVVYLVHSRLPAPVASLFSGQGDTADWSARLRTVAEVETEMAPNTIGILEGSDPELAEEYVVFTAHMDHVGVVHDAAPGADSIFNGADDDGSGTVTIIELAQAFASLEPRPRRSLVFMTVSGEERGLLGSQWYSEHPTVPLENTVANLNMDMIGRNWSDTIVAIGKQESTLGPLVESVAAARPELDMAVIDDLWPEESFYTRSDHYNFARKGVPILFFFNGVHEDYHQVTDHVDKIDFEKMARVGRLIFYTGLEIADADEPPRWDADAYDRVVEESENTEAGAGSSDSEATDDADSR